MVCQKGDPKEVSQIFRNMHNLQISPTQSGYYQYLRDHDFVFPKLDSQAIAQFINDVVIHEQNAFGNFYSSPFSFSFDYIAFHWRMLFAF